MKYLKRFEFKKESDYTEIILDLEYNDFEDVGGVSGNYLYKKYHDEELKKAVPEFFSMLESEHGITKEQLQKWYNENKEEILNSKLAKTDGFIDAILYELDNTYPLSGHHLKDDSDWMVPILKYDYNFHHSKYGRLYLLQSYKRIEDFYEDVTDRIFKSFCNEGEEQIFHQFYEKVFDKGSSYFFEIEDDVFCLQIKGCIKKENYKNGYKITVNIGDIYDIYKDIENGIKFKVYDSSIEAGITFMDMFDAFMKDVEDWNTSYDEDMKQIEIYVCD